MTYDTCGNCSSKPSLGDNEAHSRDAMEQVVLCRLLSSLRIEGGTARNILLAGPWGCGKTHLLSGLLPANSSSTWACLEGLHKNFVVLTFCPWEESAGGDPVEGFWRAIARQMETIGCKQSLKTDVREKISKTCAAIKRNFAKTVGSVLGALVVAAPNFDEALKAFGTSAMLEDLISIWTGTKDQKSEYSVEAARKAIKAMLKTIVDESAKRRILLLVDDMDRCRPEEAMAVIDTLYHFFLPRQEMLGQSDSDKDWPMSSIWAANIQILEELLAEEYKQLPSFRPDVYLEKMFHSRINIPPLTSKEECRPFWKQALDDHKITGDHYRMATVICDGLNYPIIGNMRFFHHFKNLCAQYWQTHIPPTGDEAQLQGDARLLLLSRGFPLFRDQVFAYLAYMDEFITKLNNATCADASYHDHPVYRFVHDKTLITLLRDLSVIKYRGSAYKLDQFAYHTMQGKVTALIREGF